MSRNRLVVLLVVLGLCCCLGAASAREMVYYEALSTDPGWTTEGSWQWTTSDSHCCFSEPHSAGGMYAHAPDSNYSAYMGAESLTTTAFDCSGLTSVKLHFWMGNALCNGAYLGVDVSNDGETWNTLWSTGCGRNGWDNYEFDISSVADGQSTVYVRWTLGPESYGNSNWGVDIDDVMISAETGAPSLNAILWSPYSRDDTAYGNLWGLLSQVPHSWITDSDTEDEDELSYLLQDTQVLIVSTPDWLDEEDTSRAKAALPPGVENSCMAECGYYFSDVLHEFTARGGTVIFIGETMGASGFMNATGLLGAEWTGSSVGGGRLLPAGAGLSLLEGTVPPMVSQFLTNGYRFAPDVQPVLVDDAGRTVVAQRLRGAGGAVAIGYSYDQYDDNASRVLLNALTYPRAQRKVLLYDTSNNHSAAEALTRMKLPFVTAGPSDFDSLLVSQSWDAVLVDNPAQEPGSWGGLNSFIAAGGRVAISTADLDVQPELRSELGISSAAALDVIPPVHWAPEVVDSVGDIPELLTWDDAWPISGFRLEPTPGAGFAFATYDAVPTTPAQAALIVGREGRTLAHGFLWDERNQDADENGIQDVVQLIMREMQHFLLIPTADFVADSTSGGLPLTVTFSDLSSGDPYSWYWDFGDGGTSYEQCPTHTYTEAGAFTVSLMVYGDEGMDTKTKDSYIQVVAGAPVVDFSAAPTSGAVPLPVTFSDLSTESPTSWNWDFGDGTTSTSSHPSHTYAEVGSYTVTLTARNAAGEGSLTKTAYITVTTPGPHARFYATPSFGQAPLDVQFTDESVGAPTSWEWTFGDGTTSTEQHPAHTYTRAGNYAVSLTVSNAGGSDTDTRDGCVTVWFADAPPGFWAFNEILACLESDLVQGFPDGYRPTTNVTRAQMAVFLARGLCGGDDNVPTGPAVASFLDVPTDDWAYRHVEYCKANGIAMGYGDLYRPLWEVNRGQMAVFSARAAAGGEDALASYTPPATSPFSDIATDFWAYRHITYCRDNGLVNGYVDGRYRPDLIVNRAQMAVFLARIFHLMPE